MSSIATIPSKHIGSPSPIGATLTDNGVNFCLFSRTETAKYLVNTSCHIRSAVTEEGRLSFPLLKPRKLSFDARHCSPTCGLKTDHRAAGVVVSFRARAVCDSAHTSPKSNPGFREECAEQTERTRAGRCNRHHETIGLSKVPKACSAPLASSGLVDQCDLVLGELVATQGKISSFRKVRLPAPGVGSSNRCRSSTPRARHSWRTSRNRSFCSARPCLRLRRRRIAVAR